MPSSSIEPARDEPEFGPGGRSIGDRHGHVRRGRLPQNRRWAEFRVRFTNGRVQEVHEIPAREECVTQPAGSSGLLADVAGGQTASEVDDRPEVEALLELYGLR